MRCCVQRSTAGFSYNPLAEGRAFRIETTIAHLREVLGDATYEVLARTGHSMTTTAMVSYAYEQIEQARAMLSPSG